MKIAILGSTGFVGRVLTEKALGKGFQIKSLVRNPDKLGAHKNKVEFIQGDISQIDKLDECLSGVQAVLSTVPPERNTHDPEKYARIMDDLINCIMKNGVIRFIHIGGAAHGGGENESWSFKRKLLRAFLNLTWKQGLIAKRLEWETLKKSDIDWTLVRPPRIVKGKSTEKIIVDDKILAGPKVYVDDLADFMLEQIESKEWSKKAPIVSSMK
jgi:putative NADH-flavin reductase